MKEKRRVTPGEMNRTVAGVACIGEARKNLDGGDWSIRLYNAREANWTIRGQYTAMRKSFLISLLLLSGTVARAQEWKPLGPPGGDVRALAADPARPARIFLGTADGHIFGSEDSGAHWTLLGRASSRLDAVITAIVVDPRDGNVLFASSWTRDSAAGGGVFRSADGGQYLERRGPRGPGRARAGHGAFRSERAGGRNSGRRLSFARRLQNRGSAFLPNITRNCATSIPWPSIRAIRKPSTPGRFTFPGRRPTAGAPGGPFMKA